MFLILGTPECKFCHEAKKLLDDYHLKYLYYDLTLKYGLEWRLVFNDLKALIGDQKSIPIIFRSTTPIEPTEFPATLSVASLTEWSSIGSYMHLEKLLDGLDISIDENY